MSQKQKAPINIWILQTCFQIWFNISMENAFYYFLKFDMNKIKHDPFRHNDVIKTLKDRVAGDLCTTNKSAGRTCSTQWPFPLALLRQVTLNLSHESNVVRWLSHYHFISFANSCRATTLKGRFSRLDKEGNWLFLFHLPLPCTDMFV